MYREDAHGDDVHRGQAHPGVRPQAHPGVRPVDASGTRVAVALTPLRCPATAIGRDITFARPTSSAVLISMDVCAAERGSPRPTRQEPIHQEMVRPWSPGSGVQPRRGNFRASSTLLCEQHVGLCRGDRLGVADGVEYGAAPIVGQEIKPGGDGIGRWRHTSQRRVDHCGSGSAAWSRP
jgi:hypothetical protein